MTQWIVTPDPDCPQKGRIKGPAFDAPVALGKKGVIDQDRKREGDRKTPIGLFPVRSLLWRPDRLVPPITPVPRAPLSPDQGWCDDPEDPAYNRAVQLPFGRRHEKLWRDDGLYDLILVIGHNDDPAVPGLGSAVFVHCARPDMGPTQGCVALKDMDLLRLLRFLRPGDFIRVTA